MLSPTQQKKLERLAKVLDNGDIALLTELDTLESRLEGIEGQLPALREAKDGEQGEKGERGERGEKGDSIKGDKGEDGRNGVDGLNGKNGRDGVDGRDGLDGKDGEMGIVDVATIAYLEDEIKRVEDKIPEIVKQKETNFGFVIRDVVAGTNVTIDKTDPNRPIVNATGGSGASVWGAITGTLADQTDLQTALGTKAASDHTHTGVYEPANANLLETTDIGVSVAAQGHTHTGVYEPADATILKDADIGVSVAAQSHTHNYAPALGVDDNYVTDAEKVKLSNLSNTNSGDQTSIVGITGTKAQFDTAVTDGNIMYVGDAPTAHTHAISDTTGLQTALDNKLDDTQFSGLSKITVSTSAPVAPATGDLWVDTN